MRAVVYDHFGVAPEVRDVTDPVPAADGAVVRVLASGVCRSDWHGWSGHDATIQLPHVPGHEFAGVVESVGPDVRSWQVGDMVTVPFVGGCGRCPSCHTGNQQVCDDQFQPGFTHWGAHAELVAVGRADLNLVRVPQDMAPEAAAALGCRVVTSFRAVVDQGQTRPGEWLAVHGCGGVGLSVVMIGAALGARVVAVDVSSASLELARTAGAEATVDARATADVPAAIAQVTGGGAHVSVDALGITETCTNSIRSLRKRGRHVQVGWMLGQHRTPPIPMDVVMGSELVIMGSHGIQAHRYDAVMGLVTAGRIDLEPLLGGQITLDDAPGALAGFDEDGHVGITVITSFGSG